MESELEQFFKKKIAELNGVDIEDVTQEFIDQCRERLYHQPGYRIDFPSNYGGYNTIGLRIMTPIELEQMNHEAERFLERVR